MNLKNIPFSWLVMLYLNLLSISIYAQTSQDFQLNKWSISSAAGFINSNNFTLKESTLGRLAMGMSSSNSFVLNGGMTVTGINDPSISRSTLPNHFMLMQNYPNPFNPSTTIQYSVPQKTPVTIKIYSSMGRLVRTMDQGIQNAGHFQVLWDARNDLGFIVSSGIYYYQISASGFSDVKSMLLIK